MHSNRIETEILTGWDDRVLYGVVLAPLTDDRESTNDPVSVVVTVCGEGAKALLGRLDQCYSWLPALHGR